MMREELFNVNDKCGILFSGRLGNNLYALASGLLLAKQTGKKIYFYNVPDRFSIFQNSIFRNYIDVDILHPDIPTLDNRKDVDSLLKKEKLSSYYSVSKHNPLPIDFLKEFVSTIGPTDYIKEQIKTKYENIHEMVSFHVRRGDYLTINGCWTVGLKYCNDSINIIKKKLNNADFPLLVFSDDIAWCKENIKVKNEITFFDSTYFENDVYDLYAMSLCKHNIIANSSFSQWGSYLNLNENKVVVYPEKRDNSIVPICKRYFYKCSCTE